MQTRRDFLKAGAATGAFVYLGGIGGFARAVAAGAIPGLSDPAAQPMFANAVPNALDPAFIYRPRKGTIDVGVGPGVQQTGLVDANGYLLSTPIWGYGDVADGVYTWPGRTFEVRSYEPLAVTWENKLVGPGPAKAPLPYLLTGLNGESVVDTSLHWAYSLYGYDQYSVAQNGVPIVAHVHGGHSDAIFDGNPEYFFSPAWAVRGPQWVQKKYLYDNSQPAGTVWYHDHALGITRLNVYTGMAGFYIIRDNEDTGKKNNPLDLPAYPYEAAFAIQDRMFKDNGELFYPAFPGDPFWTDFITDQGLADDVVPQPSALAEFFGDHIVVNGVIWPKMDVEPRNYRLRFLNGCDSRFLALQFWEVPAGATDFAEADGPLRFTVIGSDQGLASSPTGVSTLLCETGSRYDVIFDFTQVTPGNRVIVKNIGGDEPFGGDIPGARVFGETDRIMAFDVVLRKSGMPDVTPMTGYTTPIVAGAVSRTRKVALFEGRDEFGRLQPLLGTAEPATDYQGNPINWPADFAALTEDAPGGPLSGQMEGSIAWHSPTTENPALGSTEEWEIWNMTGDAHPVHLHLVHFEILGRQEINFDSSADEDGFIPDGTDPEDDGVYLVSQPVVQHNGLLGNGFRIVHPTDPANGYGNPVDLDADDGYVENAPKDMVTALPGQITRIKATFDKPGRYVWHCHILSHEDHEMMRVLHVGQGA